MLAYLDTLLRALAGRDIAEIDRLLAHPLARILNTEALREAQAAAAGAPAGAPLRVLQLRHQTAQLLGDLAPAADVVEAPEIRPAISAPARARRAPARYQMELPLSA
jgi:hypothetical protein